ncbi:hypothetical protein CBP12_06815 [Oceanisphaera avium]|uniref:Helicase ATP-binding domain-containing protein n=2 Tax=Oceanisphaera avium TaxID=1903694 RepID=A0A1Y0CXB0_9GAMM|nr:hypothetical protein CBP12_06815 [Oceanisphaera avium]
MNTVAVRSLCEFSARAGSLSQGYTPSPTSAQGIAGHKKVQARRPAPYQAEYLLTGECLGMSLRGRADGYVSHEDAGAASPRLALLEEIKTHRADSSRIRASQRQLHWAQLKVYGALLCQRDALSEVRLRLVYYNIDNDQETPLEECWSGADLTAFLCQLCQRYQDWHQQEQQHRKKRDQALMTLAFPFAKFRPYQRELSEAVYKAISRGHSLQLEAPTGIGKTLGVAYPALMAMPRYQLDRLFLLSARTTGRQLMLDSLSQLKGAAQAPIPVRILELTARDKACVHPHLACDGESCPLAEGFFDRLAPAREAAANHYWLDQGAINHIAAQHQLCPYYLAQEMARWCDVVVGDVNHYFDQQALLFGLSQQNNWHSVPLIDEAHNLIERARAMYSATLNQAHFKAARRAAPGELKKVFTQLERAWTRLLTTHGTSGQLDTVPSALNGALQRLITELLDYVSTTSATSDHAQLHSLLFDAMAFLKLAEQFGEHSLCTLAITERTLGKKVRRCASLAIQNLIPADFLAPRFKHAHAAILFSATLSPARYYHDLLGLPETTCGQVIASPFSARQLNVKLTRLSTRLNDRVASLSVISQRLSQQYQQQPGNYLVYVSSFAYLQQLHDYLHHHATYLPCIAQTPGMNEAERLAFIEQFRRQQGLVGLAVLGGAFGEGIDLPGEQLIGVFIATLGLPPFDDYHRQLAQRLQARFTDGYAYTYLYPGLRKVVQAAGRLIRSPEDSGVIELLDARFAHPDIARLLPNWWPAPTLIQPS